MSDPGNTFGMSRVRDGASQGAPTEVPAWINSRKLPSGGPDRVRFCIAYGDAIGKGHTDEEAREQARMAVRLLYFYLIGMGIEETKRALGPIAYGLPIEFWGEE